MVSDKPHVLIQHPVMGDHIGRISGHVRCMRFFSEVCVPRFRRVGARPECKCDSRCVLYEIPYASAVVAWLRKHLYIIDECSKLYGFIKIDFEMAWWICRKMLVCGPSSPGVYEYCMQVLAVRRCKSTGQASTTRLYLHA